jgi:O-methyltransferase involved in polyketide biosynthesis
MTDPAAESAAPTVPPGVDPAVPSPARMYDYFLGGTHNFPADREAAERIRASTPDLEDAMWSNRSFHHRAARWLAAQGGIRQFIDIGSGLPTAGNTHEIVQQAAPGATVAYVDVDPMVRAYAAELLADDGTTAVITADVRDPDAILGSAELAAVIDLTRPTALLMTALLHFVPDDADPWGLVARYVAAVPSGSYLVLSHGTADGLPQKLVRTGQDVYASAAANLHLRRRAEIERFFTGLDIVPPYAGAAPGLVGSGVWGADDPDSADSEGSRWHYCAVARRP